MAGWRRFGSIVPVCVVLALVSVGRGAEEPGAPQYSPEVQERLDALKAKGEPVTFADLALQPIPPEENAATFYRRAEDALVMEETARGLVRGVMAPGATRRIEDLRAEELTTIRRWVEENQPSLALMRQGAALENCEFFSNYEGMANPAFAVTVYKLTGLLQAWTLVEVADGKLQEALEGSRLILRLAGHLTQAGTLVAAVAEPVHIDCASKSLQDVLSRCWETRLDYGPLRREIEHLLMKNPAPQAMRTERVFVLEHLTDPTQVRKGFLSEDLHLSSYEDPQAELDRALKAHGSLEAWVDQERLAYLDGFERILAFSGKEPYQSQGERAAFSKWLSEELPARVVPSAREKLPMFLRFLVMGISRRWSLLREMALGIELERHRAARGSYPDTLEKLQLTDLKELPVDPFTGRPLVYRRQGDGYVVYSVGSNGRDDGGKLAPREGPDDIAWTVSGREGK